MTVAELHPISLLAIIITGTMIGVYGPMMFWRHCQEHWDEWPVITRVWVCFVGLIFLTLTIGSTLYLTKPMA